MHNHVSTFPPPRAPQSPLGLAAPSGWTLAAIVALAKQRSPADEVSRALPRPFKRLPAPPHLSPMLRTWCC